MLDPDERRALEDARSEAIIRAWKELAATGWRPRLSDPIEGLSETAREMFGQVVTGVEQVSEAVMVFRAPDEFGRWVDTQMDLAEAWARGEVRVPLDDDDMVLSAFAGEWLADGALQDALHPDGKDVPNREERARVLPLVEAWRELVDALEAAEAAAVLTN